MTKIVYRRKKEFLAWNFLRSTVRFFWVRALTPTASSARTPGSGDHGEEGWRFAVWAPGATAVEVCGGFDGWGAGMPAPESRHRRVERLCLRAVRGRALQIPHPRGRRQRGHAGRPLRFRVRSCRPANGQPPDQSWTSPSTTAHGWSGGTSAAICPLNIYETPCAAAGSISPTPPSPTARTAGTITKSWPGNSSPGCWNTTSPM